MKLKKLAVLAMACIMAMTAASLTGCSQNQGSTGTDETQKAVEGFSVAGCVTVPLAERLRFRLREKAGRKQS